jgi:Leucine Rich repeat
VLYHCNNKLLSLLLPSLLSLLSLLLPPSQQQQNTACTDKLIQNDPGFVELSLERLGDQFDLDEFTDALKANHTVRHVCFSGTFVRELQDHQWRIMLESIGYLQSLQELQIWCSTIPMGVLAHMLQHAHQLRKAYFFRVVLSGSQQDFDAVADALKLHPSLRDFRLGGFTLDSPEARLADPLMNHLNLLNSNENHNNANVSLDSIVKAMATTPRLQVVNMQLSAFNAVVPFSGAALAQFLTSSTVLDLYMSRLGLGNDHMAVIALALLTNTTQLKTLDLFGNNVENDHIILMANALGQNKTLETLVLPCPSDDLSIASCAAISRALRHNTTLVTLNLPRSNLTDDGLLHLSQGLTVNRTLKKVEVGVHKDIGTKGMEALTEILEKNYELERLVVSSSHKTIKEKVEYYMRLNEVGRGNLLRNGGKATREEWVEMLIHVGNDLDCLFYFISTNPAICQFANTSGADVIVTEVFTPSMRRHTIMGYVNQSPRRVESNRRASAL